MFDGNYTFGEIETGPWGCYRPGQGTFLLRLLIKLGLSRGPVCKWIRNRWKRRHSSVVDHVVRGIKFRLHIKDNTTDGKLLTSSKFYDKKEIAALGTGGVFIDIGANTGYYSLMMAMGAFSRVIAVEPNPPTLERLRANIQLNGKERIITVIPSCVGPQGFAPIYCKGGLGGASLIRPDQVTEPVFVASTPLIEIIKEQRITRIDALKIDVEGYEDRALMPFFESAPRTLWPKIMVIEHCHSEYWSKDVIRYLLGVGYCLKLKTRGNSILRIDRPMEDLHRSGQESDVIDLHQG